MAQKNWVTGHCQSERCHIFCKVSVSTHFRSGCIVNDEFIGNLLLSQTV